jgi:phosphoribosylglycinamide formyltransferase 1
MIRAKVAVLISGRGSNMAALLYAAKAPDCPFELVCVGANDPAAEGLTIAASEGIPTFAHSHKGLKRDAFDAIIHAELIKYQPEVVVLAGYMRILSAGFVEQWAGRMINIHPSLLPKYPGLDTHARALEAGDTVAGCSIHEVTAELDSGPLLSQSEVVILPGDTPDSLAERVRIAEHQLYPRTLAAFVMRERSTDWLLSQVRACAMTQPQADEVISHGMPCFGIIGGKKFAYFTHDHHGDGRTALLVKISGVDEQIMLIEQDPDRHFRPAYFGDGWLGLRLDLGDNDWDDIAAKIAQSWAYVAPAKLKRAVDVAGGF